jgi:hypothetical protein
MNDTDVVCPYCQHVQSDCTNGGDPGPWWHTDYIPDGECETACDSCRMIFVVRCEWNPSFETAKKGD